MVEQKDKIIPVDFNSIKMAIFIQANKEAPIKDIESWKKAFPDIEFEEIDDMFTGDEIDWENRNLEERAFYVAYMKDPQTAKVDFSMDIKGIRLWKVIDDSEMIWYMWMSGCFAGEPLDEKAIKTFMWYGDTSELARRYMDDLDLDEVSLLTLSVKVAPF
jgi:hypothetical protein